MHSPTEDPSWLFSIFAHQSHRGLKIDITVDDKLCKLLLSHQGSIVMLYFYNLIVNNIMI